MQKKHDREMDGRATQVGGVTDFSASEFEGFSNEWFLIWLGVNPQCCFLIEALAEVPYMIGNEYFMPGIKYLLADQVTPFRIDMMSKGAFKPPLYIGLKLFHIRILGSV